MLKSPYTNTYTYIYIHNIYKKGKRFEKVDLDDPEKDLQTMKPTESDSHDNPLIPIPPPPTAHHHIYFTLLIFRAFPTFRRVFMVMITGKW